MRPSYGSTSSGPDVVERDRHRVHREVAPREIGLDVVGEGDFGLAALGPVHVGAERRDLEPLAVLLAPDGAEALTLQPDRVGPRTHQCLDRVGAGTGGDVDVGDVAVEQCVTDAAPDEIHLMAGGLEARRELLRR